MPTLHELGHKAAACADFADFSDEDLDELKRLLLKGTPFFDFHCQHDHTQLRVGRFKELENGDISFFATCPVWSEARKSWGDSMMMDTRITKGSSAASHPMMLIPGAMEGVPQPQNMID